MVGLCKKPLAFLAGTGNWLRDWVPNEVLDRLIIAPAGAESRWIMNGETQGCEQRSPILSQAIGKAVQDAHTIQSRLKTIMARLTGPKDEKEPPGISDGQAGLTQQMELLTETLSCCLTVLAGIDGIV